MTNFAYARFDQGVNDTSEYQIGPEWGKKVITQELFKTQSKVFQETTLRTAHLKTYSGIGTAFYIGKFNNHYVCATNYHIFHAAWEFQKIDFDFYKKSFGLEKFFVALPEIDLALFSIQVTSPEEQSFFENLSTQMAFDKPLLTNLKLLTIGYGAAGNPNSLLVANQDSDCRVYSQDGELRLQADPDGRNPTDYKAWSFATGCDVSHGDSGSAMVDRSTGEILGIIWTTHVPKSKKIQDPHYLKQMQKEHSEDIWQELSYAVPASKIAEVLKDWVKSGTVAIDTAKTLTEFLNKR